MAADPRLLIVVRLHSRMSKFMIDLAQRAHAHSFHIDPIVRSLLDTDFYKFLMGQIIWKKQHNVDVTFSVILRTNHIRLRDCIEEQELREQLDHVRTLRFTNNQLIWFQGNTFYGKRNMFLPEYIEFLRNLQLPDYCLQRGDRGGYKLSFSGNWAEVTFWEIHALAIISELRSRSVLHKLSRFELDILYSNAKTKLWKKLQKLKALENLNVTDFGTRRRHSFLWQEWAILAAKEVLGVGFTGTSNAHFAMNHSLEAKGTNAHERPMVAAVLAKTDAQLRQSQYDVLLEWAEMYDGALRIALPDTFGTTQFLLNAPEWLTSWTGMRLDSKKPDVVAGEEIVNWWVSRGCDPKEKLLLFTDGLDADDIHDLHRHFNHRTRVGFGWGTMLTNDFIDCHPGGLPVLDPISIVCKVREVNGLPAVKLSDNFKKSMGPEYELAHYRQVFGTLGQTNVPVTV